MHPEEFESPASAFGGQRSIQLSYGCNVSAVSRTMRRSPVLFDAFTLAKGISRIPQNDRDPVRERLWTLQNGTARSAGLTVPPRNLSMFNVLCCDRFGIKYNEMLVAVIGLLISGRVRVSGRYGGTGG